MQLSLPETPRGKRHRGSDFELGLGGPLGICQVETGRALGTACVSMETLEKA